MLVVKTLGRFVLTAVAEIVGCYLRWDVIGPSVAVAVMAIIAFGPRAPLSL